MKRTRTTIRFRYYEILIILSLAGLASCCIVGLLSYFFQTHESKKAFKELADAAHIITVEISSEKSLQTGIKDLQTKNSDCVAWLQIEDADIDYPVMYTPKEPEYYLRRNFEKKYSISGTPFLDAKCHIESNNLIIHGHNMKSGDMFSTLENYLDKQYGLRHSKISLYLADQIRHYNLMAVLHFDVTDQNWDEYYKVPTTQTEFERYVSWLEEESLYCCGYSAKWGEQLLSLSTCDNVTQTGRIVVIAKETEPT